MHKLSAGFNKMITDKINEQTYEHRERALKYKDHLKKRETFKENNKKKKRDSEASSDMVSLNISKASE